MANVPSNLILNKVTFSVGTSEYTSHVASAIFTPSTPTAEVTDVGGTVHRFAGAAGWNLDLVLLQDWSATGLATMFLEDEGEEATVVVERADATFTATVSIAAPAIGAAGNVLAQSTISLPSSKPVRTPTV